MLGAVQFVICTLLLAILFYPTEPQRSLLKSSVVGVSFVLCFFAVLFACLFVEFILFLLTLKGIWAHFPSVQLCLYGAYVLLLTCFRLFNSCFPSKKVQREYCGLLFSDLPKRHSTQPSPSWVQKDTGALNAIA